MLQDCPGFGISSITAKAQPGAEAISIIAILSGRFSFPCSLQAICKRLGPDSLFYCLLMATCQDQEFHESQSSP